MRLPVLLFKGLVTAFCVVLPVCTVVVGIVFSCNSTLRNYALYTVTAEKAASLSALLKQEVVHSSKLCNAISSLETGKTSFSGLYTATENIGSIKYSFLNTCDNSHYYYYNNNYYYCKASDAFDLERFAKKYRRSFVFVDRYTGNVTYRSHNIPQSVLSRSDKYVQKAFGDWKAVSGRVCFWDYNTDSHRRWWEQIPWCKRTSSTPVCLEPVEVLDGVVLVHGNESPPGLGLATVAAVIAAVVVPLMFFLLFTAAVGFAIQCISKCMQDISTINSHTQSQSSGSTLWWALVPSSLAQIRTGLQGLRLCVMEMAHYTSPHFVRDIIDNVVSYTLTATKATAATELETLSSMFRDVTVMFVSLKDSGYLYSVPETRLLQVLSAFYKNFGKVIYSCNGVIDKYINGSIMAIFDVHNSGGHKDQSSSCAKDGKNEAHACKAALLFQRALERTKNELTAKGTDKSFVAQLSYRVGIHSGVIYYGSVGCEAHADYTVCGDVANVASRVKALADTYGLPTVVSGNVADKVAPGFSCVLLDVVCLKGHRVTLTRLYHLAESDSPEVGKHAAERFGRIHNDMQIGLDSEATELVWRTLRDKRFVKYKKVLCILLNRLQRKGVGENRDVIPVRLDRRKRGKNGQVPCGTRKTFAHSNNTASQKLNKQSV